MVEDTKGSSIPLYIQESFVVNLGHNPKQLYSDNGIELAGVIFGNVLVKDATIINPLLKDDKYEVFFSKNYNVHRDIALTYNVSISDLCEQTPCKWAKICDAIDVHRKKVKEHAKYCPNH